MADSELSNWLLHALKAAIPEGSTIPTLAEGRPNRVTAIQPEGVWIETTRSETAGAGAQLVEAWMLQTAWDHLELHGTITNSFVLNELNVKRSSAVCALLARLPNVRVTSSRGPIELELARP